LLLYFIAGIIGSAHTNSRSRSQTHAPATIKWTRTADVLNQVFNRGPSMVDFPLLSLPGGSTEHLFSIDPSTRSTTIFHWKHSIKQQVAAPELP
jgi:hypothetical protein